MIFFVQSVVSGVLTGLLYGLVALSFVVVYRGARIVNLAQGELLLIGGFSVWLAGLYTAMPSTLGPLVGLIITAFSGVLIERLVFRPLIGRPMTTIVLASIALMIILRGVIQLIFGAQSRPFPQILPSGTFIVYDIQFNVALCFGAIITIIATEFLHWFFMHTMVGLRLAAVAEDHLTSLSIGISVKRASAIAWMLGSLLAALAS
ncbi:MAG TPA: branched-chain amino acid ABC transporter permease, partial [Bellilinea sp.]|nr:branched-chain amino acid ABC transporter permease [Bellilinea sp.]